MRVLWKPEFAVPIFAITLGWLSSINAQEERIEVEAEGTETFDALRRQFAQELYMAQKPVGKSYLKALNRLLDKFAQKGDLESSLAVRKRIEHFEKFVKEYQEMIDKIMVEKQPAGELFPEFEVEPKAGAKH